MSDGGLLLSWNESSNTTYMKEEVDRLVPNRPRNIQAPPLWRNEGLNTQRKTSLSKNVKYNNELNSHMAWPLVHRSRDHVLSPQRHPCPLRSNSFRSLGPLNKECKSHPKTQTSNQYTNVYRRTRFRKKCHWWTTYIFAAIGWRSVEKLAYSRRRMILLYWGKFLNGNIRSCSMSCWYKRGKNNKNARYEEGNVIGESKRNLGAVRSRGVPPYISHIGMCRPQGYGFNSAPFRSIDVAHFGLESGMVFEETTWVYERICRFNSKWMRKKEKYANSKWILRNLFVSVLI